MVNKMKEKKEKYLVIEMDNPNLYLSQLGRAATLKQAIELAKSPSPSFHYRFIIRIPKKLPEYQKNHLEENPEVRSSKVIRTFTTYGHIDSSFFNGKTIDTVWWQIYYDLNKGYGWRRW